MAGTIFAMCSPLKNCYMDRACKCMRFVLWRLSLDSDYKVNNPIVFAHGVALEKTRLEEYLKNRKIVKSNSPCFCEHSEVESTISRYINKAHCSIRITYCELVSLNVNYSTLSRPTIDIISYFLVKILN